MSICDSCKSKDKCALNYCEKYERNLEQTNEDWFCSLSTEEKARFIADNDGTIQICDEVDYQNTMTKWSTWLKQPHREVNK